MHRDARKLSYFAVNFDISIRLHAIFSKIVFSKNIQKSKSYSHFDVSISYNLPYNL